MFQDAPDLVNAVKAGPAARVVPGQAEGPGAVQARSTTSTRTPRASTRSSTSSRLLDKIFDILTSIQNMALAAAIVMAVAALLLVANTIQVAAYSKRREVAVMKLVGASNWFIQAPFVLEAVVAGLIGSLLGLVRSGRGEVSALDGSLERLGRAAHADQLGRHPADASR